MRGHSLAPISITPHPTGGWTLHIEDSPDGRRLAADLMHTACGSHRLLVVPDIVGTREQLAPLGDWPDPFAGPPCEACRDTGFRVVEVEDSTLDRESCECPIGVERARRVGRPREPRGFMRPEL